MRRRKARNIIEKAIYIRMAIAKGEYDDEIWRTINGTKVEFGEDGQIINGPDGLKDWAKNGGSSNSAGSKSGSSDRQVVDGKDISGSYTGSSDINDVLAAQGFNGLPQVASGDDFDKAVEESSFIAQRTYSASSEEVLREYQDMLYDGDFYVDCTDGGAQYGQGMYCAADYNGELTEGIESEMEHYREQGTDLTRYEAMNDYVNSLTADDLNSSYYLNDNPLTQDEARVFLDLKGSDKILSDLSDSDRAIAAGMQESGKWQSASLALDEDFTRPFVEDYTGHSVTETLTLDKSANIISYNELQNMKNGGEPYEYKMEKISEYTSKVDTDPGCAAYFRINSLTSQNSSNDFYLASDWAEKNPEKEAAAEDYWKQISQEASQIKNTNKYSDWDSGAYAALKGYDAINAEGHGDSGSYTVVLNRTKMVLQDNRIVAKAVNKMEFKPGKNGKMIAFKNGKEVGWVQVYGTGSSEDKKKVKRSGGKKKMKKSKAQKLIDQAVEKAMGGVRKDWITINGTHVEIDGDGNIVSGPSNLKDGGSGKESKGSSSSAKTKADSKNKIVDGKIPNMFLMNKKDKEELQKEIVKIDPHDRKPQLDSGKYGEKQLLERGNRSEFASLVLDYYPDICEEIGFTQHDAVNYYRDYIDFTKDDGIFTITDNDDYGYYFDTDMRYLGSGHEGYTP